MEKRAIQVSHGLWQQVMTQGYSSGGIKCLYGLPEDAKFVQAFYKQVGIVGPDVIFVFESDSWGDIVDWKTSTVKSLDRADVLNEVYPLIMPVFQTAECQTCEWWADPGNTDAGMCVRGNTDRTLVTGQLLTSADFGCVQYEKRDD